MALISSSTISEGVKLTGKIAAEDIVAVNEAGQSVVLVPAGQRIPEGVDVPKAKRSAPEDKSKSAKDSK